MNTFDGFCNNCFNTKIHWAKSGMFTRGALTITFTSYNYIEESLFYILFTFVGECRFYITESILAILRYIRTEFKVWACRHNVVSSDFIPYFDSHFSFDFFWHRNIAWRFADIWTAQDIVIWITARFYN